MTEPRVPQQAPPVAVDPDPDELASANALVARVVSLQDELDRMMDHATRVQADLENAQKRSVRDVQAAREAERVRAARLFLPVVDHLELALEHDVGPADPFVEGVRSVLAQGVAALRQLGFPRIDEVGQPFDPRRHEAVTTQVSANAEPGTVLQVVRPGYGDDGVQLRPASVVVAKKPD